MQEKEIILNKKKFFYREEGEGPAVVLLHGFAEKGSIWKQQFGFFSGYRLLIPDLPGSGGSEAIEDMSMVGLARTIHDYLERLSVKKIILIGHSMGGYITLAFAEKYADQLAGFGLFHSTAYADSEEKKQTRKKGIRFIEEHGAYEFLKISIPNLYSPITKNRHPEIIEEQIDGSHNFSAHSLVSYYESMIRRPDRTQVLKTTILPVLFILGKHDGAVPLSDGLELCRVPGISYIHILEQSAHMGMKEEPLESNQALINYIHSIYHQTP
ncbi:MAG: alpha/beta fold hydrolase [Flavisolibacter sp.]